MFGGSFPLQDDILSASLGRIVEDSTLIPVSRSRRKTSDSHRNRVGEGGSARQCGLSRKRLWLRTATIREPRAVLEDLLKRPRIRKSHRVSARMTPRGVPDPHNAQYGRASNSHAVHGGSAAGSSTARSFGPVPVFTLS